MINPSNRKTIKERAWIKVAIYWLCNIETIREYNKLVIF